MADEKDVAVVETSMANPKQAVNVLENIDKVSAGTTPVATLQNNAPLFKQEENNNFMNSDAWSDYLNDTFRAYNSKRYPGFAAIETTAANPAYSTIINRYGKAVADRAQAIHSTYAKANNWFGRVADAYDAQRYGLRSAAARKDLSDAIRGGDEAEIARAKMRYQSEQRKSYEEGVTFDEYGNTLMSLLASTARNPETIPVEIGGALLAPYTGGLSEGAARAINAAIVGADTYRLETGSALESLDKETEGLSEEQKFNAARPAGAINAAVEAGLFGIGGNVAGRGLKGIGTEVAIRSTQRAVKKKTGEEISYEQAKELVKTDFLKALQKPAAEKTFKKTVAEFAANTAKGAPVEGWQEVFQDSVTDAMLRSVKNGTTLTEEMLDDWADFALDPFSEKHADKWETFINVSLASLVMGGGYSAAGAGVRKVGGMVIGDTKHDGTGTIQDKALGAYNNTLGLSKLFSWHKNGDSKNAVGASNAVLEEQIKRGEVSGKLYTTAEQVQEMQQDPEIAAALEEMGIATSLSESAENGGVVEIDLLAYDKVVNESQNTTLFQKMRNYLSFSDTTMSLNEFNQFVNSKGKELASLITDEVRNNEESVYNRLKNMAIKAGRTAERAEGYAVMGHVLLNNLQALTKGEKNDILDRLTLTVDQGNGQILSENFGAKQEAKQPTQGLSAIDGSALTTYDAQGNLKDEVWQQIRNLFPAEKLQQVYTSERGGSRTFEELLRGTVDTPQKAAQEIQMQAIEPVAKYFEITPEQLMNAIRLARGETMTQAEDGGANVPVGQMVNEVFTENLEDGTTYEGDTINIDGKERSVYNSNGDRIAKSEKALRAFYKWFGNSKVVDEQGRPLVVYHGTKAEFDTFLGSKIGQSGTSEGVGFYFIGDKALAEGYGDAMPVYLKLEHPVYAYSKMFIAEDYDGDLDIMEANDQMIKEGFHKVVNILKDKGFDFYDEINKYIDDLPTDTTTENLLDGFDTIIKDTLKAEDYNEDQLYDEMRKAETQAFGIDGYITKNYNNTGKPVYVAFVSNQVKSVNNDGTFDADTGNVYHMFVGTGADTTVLPQGLQDRIQKAKDMMAEGKSDEEVFKETRLHIAPDGKLRIQISDVDGQLTEDSGRVLKWTKDKYGKEKLRSTTCHLEDIFDHELLYELYPGLRSLPVTIKGSSTYASGLGSYINLGTNETKSRIRQSILHEVQHIIQHYESFAKGGKSSYPKTTNMDYARRNTLIHKVAPKLVENKVITYWAASEGGDSDSYMYNRLGSPDEMRALIDSPAVKEIAAKDEEFAKDIEEIRALNKKLEGLDGRLAAIRYFRLFGEAEARLTERLSYMTQEQLDTKDPYGYFDVTKFVVTNRQGVVVAKVEAPKNQQQTGEFNVVFDPETGRSIIDGSLVEAGRTSARNGKYEIRLAPEANAVTFAHELFHVFSLEMQRVYNEGTITDYWKKQADKMFKIAGAEPQVDPADPTVVRYFLTEAQEEHLANMFTTYIMKGKIENQEVRGLLSKLIDLFKTTYRQLEGAGLTPMALDSKALEFFNTVMSTQDAIEEIQRNAGLLEILPPEGVDRELYDYYIANLAVSKVEASNDLRRKLYAIDTFKNGAEYTKKMQEFKDNAKAELLEDDKYKVLAQASLYPEDKAQQTLLWAEKNIPEANFTLGDITDILENTPSLEEASTRAAEEEMDKYLAKRFNLTPQDVGFKEERNRAKVRALLAESVMQRGGTIADMEAEIRKADAASDKHLGKTSVYQIMDLGKWKNREAAAVERYAWAKNEGRKDLMSAERYNQAVLNLIMIKSAGFKNEYQKLTALFDKLQSRQRKYKRKDEFGNEYGEYEHRYHAQDWELLRSISENFGNKIRDGRRSMKPVHQQMKEWIQTQVENRFTTVAGLEDFIPFIDKGTDGSIGAMKGKDFKKLWAVMHTIDSIAMREQQLYLDGQYADMNKYIEQTLQFHSEKDIKTDEDKGYWYHRYFGRYGTWQNPEPLLRAIFPPEVFQKIFLPMFNGALKSEAKAKQWIERWKRAKAKINTSNEVFALDDGTQITYGETNKKTMTYGDVANLLIAMGAEHSYENYKLKFGLSDEQAEQIASQAIKRNAKYVEFMNETWKVYGEATELLNDSFQERTNELFVRKEHRAFTIDGIKFEGGYVPEDKHYLALVRELGTWNQGIHNKVENKNEKLITKLADGDILSIIDITETKLSQSAKWAYAAIPYNNVKKFVEKKEVSDVIGERAFNFIRDWLQNWDTPHVDESGVWRPLTRVTTIAALGMRASTALLQVSGLAQAMAHLGPTYLARGMLQFVREGGFFHPFKGPRDKSLYMATRVEDPFAARFGTESQGRSFREIFESYNAKSGLGKIGVGLLSAYQTLAMMGIQIIDGWVATITWNGAYRRALDQGMTKTEAELEADSAVRVTQSDATQISRSSAMQEPWARSVTAFATWTMAMRSQVVALSSSKSYRKDMAMWLATYAVMSSFIEAFLKEMTEPADEGEEDKEMLERIMNSWYNKIVEALGTQVMPFAGAGAAGAKMLAGALVNTDDEKIFKVFAGGSVPALQYASRAVQAGAQSIKYMRSGEEEDLDKMLIQSAGLVSYELKKRVKQALED